MKTSSVDLVDCIIQLSAAYVVKYTEILAHLPLVEKDEQWPSPCLLQEYNDGFMCWKPVKIKDKLTFENIEQALEIKLHPSISQYYTVIYSENIPATCEEGHLQLLFAWSEQDFERLQQNIIGHIMMKQKLKQELTIFFAVTDDDNVLLSVNNSTGEVWAEKVGCQSHKKMADNLFEFIKDLQPDIYVKPT